MRSGGDRRELVACTPWVSKIADSPIRQIVNWHFSLVNMS
jgi:hypothetical protein